MNPNEPKSAEKPWQPTTIRMIPGRPWHIKDPIEWAGVRGEPARGVLVNNARIVHDDKPKGLRTIVNASRRERMAMKPIAGRFAAQLRGHFTETRVERAKEAAERKALREAVS